MSQLSRRESPLPDGVQRSASESGSARPTLEPILQNALETLDINLEEELARYRRHILLQQRAARQNPTQPVAVTESPFSFAGLEQGLDDSFPPAILPKDVDQLSASVTESNPDLDSVQTPEMDMVSQPLSSSELVPVNSEAIDNGQPPEGVSFDLVPTRASEELAPGLPPNPDDYLESSEELLRSLEDEEKRAEAIAADSVKSDPKQSLIDSIFTPLGVGSILLLILSSATLGYLVIRPSTLNMVASWFDLDNNASPGRTQIQPEGGLSNLSPDLAASEFDPLKASNLSSLPGVVEQKALDTPNQAEGETEGTTENAEASNSEASNSDASNSEASASASSAVSSRVNNSGFPNTGGAAVAPPARVVGPSLSTSLPTAPPRVAPPRPGRTPRAATPSPAPTPPPPRVTPPAPIRTTPVTATPAPRRAPTVPVDDVVPGPIPTPVEEQEGDPSIGVRPTVPTAPAAQQAPPSPQTSSSPSPAPVATPAPAPAPAPVATPAPAPAPSPVATPAPAPAPTAVASPSPPTSSSPVQEDLYYVTTPYTGDQSLESAREAVSGSYVRSFPEGTQVQMGAFSNPSGAETLRQDLQEQGIQAEIYKEE